MPRIRNWQEYTMFRADPRVSYTNIDSLFTKIIDWQLIEEYWEDFMQVVVSIKAGTVSTKFLLQQLTNYARSNKLLKGLQELGHVVRTLFLIEYLSDIDLRAIITSTTNKAENFNEFSDWIRIGDKHHIVASNDPREQEKVIKCNLLIANAMMLQNVIDFTNARRPVGTLREHALSERTHAPSANRPRRPKRKALITCSARSNASRNEVPQ